MYQMNVKKVAMAAEFFSGCKNSAEVIKRFQSLDKNDQAIVAKNTMLTCFLIAGQRIENKSGHVCKDCNGLGFFFRFKSEEVECPACKGSGWKKVQCNICKGKGCKLCDGTGIYELRPTIKFRQGKKCINCDGTGKVRKLVKTELEYVKKCQKCNGTGIPEKLTQPLIPAGLIKIKS